jgi:hypothetical protein
MIFKPFVPEPDMKRATRIFLESLWGYNGVIAMSQELFDGDIKLTNPSIGSG